MSERSGYSPLQIALHWLIAALIFAAWFTHEGMGKALKARFEQGDATTPVHVFLGLAVLTFVILRIGVRLHRGAPPTNPDTSPAMAAAALWGHRLLYLLMVLTPVLGIITWSRGIESVGEAHEVFGTALFLVAIGHALVALWHQYVQKDGVLLRMVKPKG